MNPQDNQSSGNQSSQAPPQSESTPPSQPANAMAITGFILSFLFSPLGLVFSLVGLNKAKQLGGANKGLAVAGIVISSFGVLILAGTIILLVSAVPVAQVSQRNDVRVSDASYIASGIGEYRATQNELPNSLSDLAIVIDPSQLNHYQAADINPAGSLNGSLPTPADAGQFNQGVTGLEVSPGEDGSPESYSFGTNAGSLGAAEPAAADKLVVLKQAGCGPDGSIVAAGARGVAIAYRLEDQDNIACLEI